MRIAVIDIGTNTINLLVAETNNQGGYNIIHSSKITARIGQGGINDNRLTPEAIERGIEAINTHMETLQNVGNVEKVVAIGTSALRSAHNATDFTTPIKEKYGIDTHIITGDEEAKMIFDGVKQVVPLGRERALILDIGGGSCEFIIANKDGISWQHSYEIGMTRMLDLFHPSDPITPQEIKATENHMRRSLTSLYQALKNYPTETLIGTSGSFDTIAALVAAQNHPSLNPRLSTSYEIPISSFTETYHKLIGSTAQQRLAMKRMDKNRVDLIIPGAILINLVINELRIEQLFQCSFALKQGALLQVLSGEGIGKE